MSDTNSYYFEAYAAIMKITLRDGDATLEEQQFLQRLGRKLGITTEEYFDLKDSYLMYKISAPYTYEERLESMFRLSEIVYEDERLNNNLKNKWLQRIGIAIGFDPSYIGHIVTRSLDLFRERENLDLSLYVQSIKEFFKLDS